MFCFCSDWSRRDASSVLAQIVDIALLVVYPCLTASPKQYTAAAASVGRATEKASTQVRMEREFDANVRFFVDYLGLTAKDLKPFSLTLACMCLWEKEPRLLVVLQNGTFSYFS